MNGLSERLREPEPTAAEIARMRGWLLAVAAHAASLAAPSVRYLVVTPLGIPDRAWLWRTLEGLGVTPLGRRAMPSWPAVSSALYVKRIDDEALRRAVLFERAWDARFAGAPAEAWALAPGSHARMDAVKRAVRANMRHLRIALDGSDRGAVLHPFHLADPCDAAREARLLVAALLLRSSARCSPAAGCLSVRAAAS